VQSFSASSLSLTNDLTYDVCIIGSGPAGATIAQELSGGPLRVAILESGSFERRDSADELNAVESVGWPRIGDQWLVRNRIVGGTSHTWSGRCVAFDDIDFEQRDWIPNSGWPITAKEIKPYLERASSYLGLNSEILSQNKEFWTTTKHKKPSYEFDEKKIRPYFWQFSRDKIKSSDHMRFGIHLKSSLADNVTLITDATVCQINLKSSGNEVEMVEVASPDGRRYLIKASFVIACTGGVENARILLWSDGVFRDGIGNQFGVVGRYLMDHLRGPIAKFPIPGTELLRREFGHYRIKTGHVFSYGMHLSPNVQQAEKLVNCAAWLEGRIADDDPYNALKRWIKANPKLPEDASFILKNLGFLGRGIKDRVFDRKGLIRKIDCLNLVGMCEQIPDPESRLVLSDVRDHFGVPIPRIDWRIHKQEEQTMKRMGELVALEFSRIGLQAPELDTWIVKNEHIPQNFRDVAHPIGTTRMGSSPKNSVVNRECQVHDVKGLYIAGSSVFPTSSHANPTYMIVALAIKISDAIKSQSIKMNI